MENNFDAWKSQWSWVGCTTRDLLRCQMSARIGALAYNCWTLFSLFATAGLDGEEIMARPLLPHGMARQARRWLMS